MRDYRKNSAKAMRYRELRRGIELMRQAAVKVFKELGHGEVSGYTAADMLTVLDPMAKGSWKIET